MKHFTFKWLRRFYLIIATKLFIIAVCLTLLRLLFMNVDQYKEGFSLWIADKYNINLSVKDISAGVDFSGLIIVLNNIELKDSQDLPFVLTTDYLFLHLDFWDSIVNRSFNFNRISLKGVDLTIKQSHSTETKSEQSLVTLDSLQTVFLQQLDQVSVTDSRIHFKNHLDVDKTIVIEKLRWLNNGETHQGVGNASLPESLGDNALQFVIDLSGEKGTPEDPLQGSLYVNADNLNITDYLTNLANPDAQISEAVLGFQIWAEFSSTKLQRAQVVLNDSQLVWSQADRQHDWRLNSGLLQLTNSNNGWLIDSYDLDVVHNQKQLQDLMVSGHGNDQQASFDFTGLEVSDLLPFYLLKSGLSASQTVLLQSLDIDAGLKRLEISKNNANQLSFAAQLKAFKNRPQGAIPGVSNAQIDIHGDLSQGKVNIKLPKQKIYFDGQFTRTMPVQSADLRLQWQATASGLKVFSEQSLLKTDDLDTITAFSLLFPNKSAVNQSPFLSLYTYASLNDGGKAQYYYPVKALGEKVFGYLQPTLKKGQVDGAKILWYGPLNHYPYLEHDGIFQAWVPLRNAQYDFYGQWQGLTDLDLDLLFENDALTMDAKQATLGEVKLQTLSAKIDHLNHKGVLHINADVKEDAQKVSDYLKGSPLKESVGEALNILVVQKPLTGHLQLTIPFDHDEQQTEINGDVTLLDNDIDVELTDDIVLPLKNLRGQFNFVNGNIMGKNIVAQLFEQDVQLSFDTAQKNKTYQVNVDVGGVWKLHPLQQVLPELAPLELTGKLDWTGRVHFKHYFSGGYMSRVSLESATQGVTSKLPFPFNKNALQSWPTEIVITSDNENTVFNANIKDKLDFIGQLDYNNKPLSIPYYAVKIGQEKLTQVDKSKRQINIDLDGLDISDWYRLWAQQESSSTKMTGLPSIEPDEMHANLKHATLFEQPFSALKIDAVNDKQKWNADIDSLNLQAKVEYHSSIPARLDFDINKLDFRNMDLSTLNDQKGTLNEKLMSQSDNLQTVYPEIFAKCTTCLYGNYDFSPLKLHIYPNKNNLIVDYINIGTKNELTTISGMWDQRRTNMLLNSQANEKNNIVKRLGYASPIVAQQAELNATVNWLGAPWQFNLESLNGVASSTLKDGSITEVSDNGARLLSLFSLDAIRRSLNLEFNNIFDKGFNFDELTMSGKITDGIIKNDDFYLDGSAGKIVGNGLIDLPNYYTNFNFNYSPAVTSSLPVLTAFAINPLTGAAVLLLSKILEPVVETIVRVDFSVKGPLNDPAVKLVSREKGKVKLKESDLLEEINKLKKENKEAISNDQ